MAGHSKWAKVKHQKEVSDAAKGKLFTKLANAIIIAVKEGGGVADPEKNFKLRLAVERARSFNMPKENIERAIERGKGKEEGEGLIEVTYEAFGPGGVGMIIEAATDNRQRTVATLKNILERQGGVLAEAGAVSHFFQYVGFIHLAKSNKKDEEIIQAIIDSGALDYKEEEEGIEIYTNPQDLHKIKTFFENQGFKIFSYELFYRANVLVPIREKEKAEQVLRLIEQLEEVEEVQKVFANFDIPERYLEEEKHA